MYHSENIIISMQAKKNVYNINNIGPIDKKKCSLHRRFGVILVKSQ